VAASIPANYLSIIGQVARSIHSPKEIATNLDLEPATVSNYLHTLVKLGLLRHEVPATERQPERSRKSCYEVADPHLRFYYRFLEPQLAYIARGAYQAVWQTIERHSVQSLINLFGFWLVQVGNGEDRLTIKMIDQLQQAGRRSDTSLARRTSWYHSTPRSKPVPASCAGW